MERGLKKLGGEGKRLMGEERKEKRELGKVEEQGNEGA